MNKLYKRVKVRVGVDFEWSNKSFTHNLFRLFEMIFGRKHGIRPEMSAHASIDEKGIHVTYACHTFEAVCALTEQYIREYIASWKFVPFKVYIPILITPQGIPVFASPYLFAIAWVASGNTGNNEGVTPWSFSFTNTGSNMTDVMSMQYWTNDGAVTRNTPTYNSVNLTLGVSTLCNTTGHYTADVWYQASPTTGANTASVTFNSGSYGEMGMTSFSGTNTASPKDATAFTDKSASAGTSISTSITTNFANSYIVDCVGAPVATSLTNSQTTEWIDSTRLSGASRKSTTTAGSYAMAWNWSGTQNSGQSVIAIRELPSTVNSNFLMFM